MCEYEKYTYIYSLCKGLIFKNNNCLCSMVKPQDLMMKTRDLNFKE